VRISDLPRIVVGFRVAGFKCLRREGAAIALAGRADLPKFGDRHTFEVLSRGPKFFVMKEWLATKKLFEHRLSFRGCDELWFQLKTMDSGRRVSA
jgi:hypothetical protein